MFKLSTKFKIILAVFGIIVLIFIIQSTVSYVNTEKKRETFANRREHFENDEEKPNMEQDERAKDTGKPNMTVSKEVKKEKDIKLNILDTVEDAFDRYYKDAKDKKSMVYDLLLRKETFNEIKEKEEQGKDVRRVVMDIIKTKMAEINSITPIDNVDMYENADPKTTDKAMEKLQKTINYEIVKNHLDEIVTKVHEVQKELQKNQDFTPKSPVIEKFIDEPRHKGPKASHDVIEGFEQRINYATY
jgi:hypothetical protein